MRNLKRGVCLCIVLGLLVFLTGCPSPAEKDQPRGQAYFNYFDTVSYVYSYAGDSEADFEENCKAVESVLEEYHRLFDIYHAYSGVNNLHTVNEMAGGQPVKVDGRLIEFLQYCLRLEETTRGEMNIMLGPVLKIWHDCRTAATDDPNSARVPSEEELRAAEAYADVSLLEIDAENSTVRLTDPNASIDVGAVGKGYATEMAARRLQELGAEGYVLNIGGNIRIVGAKPDGTGWKTGIRDPQAPDERYACYLNIQDTACVTSGVYERFYTVNGQRYHHVVDPDTLFPADYFASVTIITEDSGLADVLSTALFCMPYEDGLALAESMEGVEVLWIFPDGEMRHTQGLADLMVE